MKKYPVLIPQNKPTKHKNFSNDFVLVVPRKHLSNRNMSKTLHSDPESIFRIKIL